MAMVMPRARSSGALSIWSKGVKSAWPFSASTLVIAAVSVVFPWSTCPIVPTFTCGLVRSNFFFAIAMVPFSPPIAVGQGWMDARPAARAHQESIDGHWRMGFAGEGAHDQIRTGDLVLTKNALCRLSYVGGTDDDRPPRAGAIVLA